ncbi:MAG: hypothetical protein KKE44_04995 [Proteobacteria bacterium]|nr:hypothetical protein [Pseudomonadota bacterium]MBU1582090.1 hypothetical protein [Pseudomonadota bacterium]MBU2452441.1 hypothetical protein [Pseudomonadota bacterium]MBU2631378.1 hypothetical protein [Pseudomonadota bacterium]
MEVAWHMTKGFPQEFPDGVLRELGTAYGILDSSEPCLEAVLSKPDRIYVGDEFCPARMPDLHGLSRFIRFADKKELPLTLLTPVLTDPGIEHLIPLFDRVSRWNPASEVVINDLGVLFFLKKRYPDFQLSMGRLFNKGFKDPRLDLNKSRVSEKINGFLNDCSFNRENIQILAEGLGIKRVEQDLLPYADPASVGMSRLKTAVYLPFGYVTTGRVCFTAGLNPHTDNRFSLGAACSSPCAVHRMELKHPDLVFKLFQNGNTIFYLYTLTMIRFLLENARQKGFRLIFQGGLI